jgi:hypothetical protein
VRLLAGISIVSRSNAPDGVASAKANPLRNRAVLLLGLGKLLLGSESLVALERISRQHHDG